MIGKAELVALDAINRIRLRRGLRAELSRATGLAHQTLAKWETVPLEHVFTVARVANVLPEQLRPDYFINDPMRAASAKAVIDRHPGTVTPRHKYQTLTDSDRAAWRDPSLKTYKAVARALNHKVTIRTLLEHFGPRAPTAHR